MYHSIIDSLKVRKLSESAQLDYFLMLCCASEFRERTGLNTGETGLTVPDAVWRTRSGTLEGTFPALFDAGLLTVDEHSKIAVTGWQEKQFTSDDVAARTRKAKDKSKGNVPGTVPGNVRDTDTDTDTTHERFAQFWLAYPKKKNKGDAEKVWKQIKPSPDLLSRMLVALVAAKQSLDWRKERGQYIPNPAKWLRARGWEDESSVASDAELPV